MSEQPHNQRKIRNYLLNRGYQLRYTAVMVLLSAVLTAGLGYVWFAQVQETSRTIEVRALGTMGEDAVAELQREMERRDLRGLLVLVGFGALLALLVAAYGIVLTHKVAGPLFKISRYMEHVGSGRLGQIHDIRRGDQLQEFFELFKRMHGSLRERTASEASELGELLEVAREALAGLEEDDEAHQRLERLAAGLEALRDAKQAALRA